MSDLHDEANSALRTLVGSEAEFRPDQFEAIEALVADRRRVLVVQRTGWGKSAVYFVATRMLRDRGAGPTLLVSPLLSLMRNQIEAGERGGVRAARITSDNTDDWEKIVADLDADRVDLLLVSPERFANPQFRDTVLPDLAERIGLLVIDEAHCISDWGHDFRPDYRRIARILNLLPEGVPVLCTTATANDRVVEDVVDQLGHDLLLLRGTLDRRSLALDVLHLPNQAERLAWLAQAIPTLPGHRHRLRADDRRRAPGRGVARRARHHGAGVHRRRSFGRAARGRVDVAAQRAEVRRGHFRARHGLRQARPRVRHPLPDAGVRDRVLPTGRARWARVGKCRARSGWWATRIARSRTTSSTPRSRLVPTPSRWWRCSTKTSG